MTKPKHTPGPWVVEPDWISGDGNSNHAVVHLNFDEMRVTPEDACLIAAAPELLDILQWIADHPAFKADPHAFGMKFNIDPDWITQVVAKATGGAE